jgi:hypothetical protein
MSDDGKYPGYANDLAQWKLRKDSYYRCDHCHNGGFRACEPGCMLVEHPMIIGSVRKVWYCGCEPSGGAICNRQREFILQGGR